MDSILLSRKTEFLFHLLFCYVPLVLSIFTYVLDVTLSASSLLSNVYACFGRKKFNKPDSFQGLKFSCLRCDSLV